MLRGRRLPLPQSPLSRWRTTAPAPRLRRDPARPAHFTTSAPRRGDDAHDEKPKSNAETGDGQAKPRGRSRLRVHKIGVRGDDWALLHGRWSAQPTTRHVVSSLRGKKPFGDRNEYFEHVAREVARRQRLYEAKLRDPPQEVKKADDYEFRSIRLRPDEFVAIRKHDVAPRPDKVMATRKPMVAPRPRMSMAARKHTVGLEARRLGDKGRRPRDVPCGAVEAEDRWARKLPPVDTTRIGRQTGKGVYLKRLWGYDDAPSELAKPPEVRVARRLRDKLREMPQQARRKTKRTPSSVAKDNLRDKKLSRKKPSSVEGTAHVSSDGLQGTMGPAPVEKGPIEQRVETDQAQGAANSQARPELWTEFSPRVSEAITHQYKLVESGSKPLSKPRPFGLPEALSPQAPHRDKPSDAVQYSAECPVTAADIGPAESLQRSFANDPVLMKARSLAEMPSSSKWPAVRPKAPIGARFRLVLSRMTDPEMKFKTALRPEVITQSLESHISELQIGDGTKSQPEQAQQRPVGVSTPISVEPEAADSERSKAPDGVEVEAPRDDDQVDVQEAPSPENKSSRLVEPAQPPPDNRSVFEKLFAEQERTKGADPGGQYAKLKIAERAAKRGKSREGSQQDEPEKNPQDGSKSRRELSIFQQLFPDQAQPHTEKSEQASPRTTHGLLQPPEDSIMVSLRNEIRNWLPEEAKGEEISPKPGDYGSHSTVVVISGTSPSLMDTDFYRIAPEGQHVEGWAGGLVKVIQAHDSVSYEPLGQYYLMFHSRPSALAYVDEIWRLHDLSRRLLHAPGSSGREVARGALAAAPASPQPFLTDAERAAVRSFTLFSPHVTPRASVRMWNTQLVRELAEKSSIADVLPALRPEGGGGGGSRAYAPARVLLRLTSPDGQHGEGRGGLTADELWLTLRDDGRERSAPWVLANLSEGIMPVKPRFMSERYKITVRAEPVPLSMEEEPGNSDGDEEGEDVDALYAVRGGGGPVTGPAPTPKDGGGGGGKKDGDPVDRNARFRRFVLTFTEPAIARRFVRCWHKRVVYDALLDRSVVIDAVAIM